MAAALFRFEKFICLFSIQNFIGNKSDIRVLVPIPESHEKWHFEYLSNFFTFCLEVLDDFFQFSQLFFLHGTATRTRSTINFFYNLHLLRKAIQTFLFVFRIFLYKFWSNAWWPQRNSQIQSIHGWNIHKNEYCNKSQKLGSDGPQTFAQCRQNAKTTTIDILWCNKCEYILLISLKCSHL